MLQSHGPLKHQHMVASDSETESDDLSNYYGAQAQKRNIKGKRIDGESSESVKRWKEEPGAVIRRAEMYQEYMKQIPIPSARGSVIPFITWQELAKSVKQLYGQPLHYLTNVMLKQWDQSRIGTEDEHKPMDNIIHPCKAEATIWLVEEVHRRSSSHHHLAKLWLSDPMHHGFVDPAIFCQS